MCAMSFNNQKVMVAVRNEGVENNGKGFRKSFYVFMKMKLFLKYSIIEIM